MIKEVNSPYFVKIGAPATRALLSQNINTPEDLSKFTKKEILSLHGVGPHALPALEYALKEHGLTFKDEV
jgi:hypothetical protein